MLTAVGIIAWSLIEGNPSVKLVPIGVVALWFSSMDVTVALIAVTVPFLCIHIVLRGHYVAVLRASTGETDPVAPPFSGVQSAIDGVKSIVILFVYFLPALVLSGFGLSIQLVSNSGMGGILLNTVGAFAFLFGLFAFIAAVYLAPAAITLFAHKNSLQAAFDRSTVRTCALSEDYAVGWLLAKLVLLVFTPIAILLQIVLVGFSLRFYLHISVNHMYAMAVTNALDLTECDMIPEENKTNPTDEIVSPR